jgi:hypothetical protein
MENLNNLNKEQEIENLLDSVKDYRFADLKPRFRLNPRLALYLDEFVLSGANNGKISEIDSVLESKDVAVLVGDIRMGTSSVGRAWVLQDYQKRRNVDLHGYQEGIEDPASKFTEPQIFLDELEGDKQNLDMVKKLVSDGRKLVLRPHLKGVVFYRDEFVKAEISFGEVTVKPLTDEDMHDYLSRRFSIGKDDPFVNFITELSGGSLFVANYICGEFLGRDYGESQTLTKKQTSKILEESYYQIYLIYSQSQKRAKTMPDDLKEILPDPKLMYLFS